MRPRTTLRWMLVAATLGIVGLLAPTAALAGTESCGGNFYLGKGDCIVGTVDGAVSVSVEGTMTALQLADLTVTAYEWLGEGPFGPILGDELTSCTASAAFPVAQASCSSSSTLTTPRAELFVYCLATGSTNSIGTLRCAIETP